MFGMYKKYVILITFSDILHSKYTVTRTLSYLEDNLCCIYFVRKQIKIAFLGEYTVRARVSLCVSSIQLKTKLSVGLLRRTL